MSATFLLILVVATLDVGTTAAAPKVPLCGSPLVVKSEVLMARSLGKDDRANITLELQPDEEALLTITTGGSQRGRSSQGVNLEEIGLCDGLGDDLASPVVVDDDDPGCIWEDDDDSPYDAPVEPVLEVRLVDELGDVLSEQLPPISSHPSNYGYVWARGQHGVCAHPTGLQVVGLQDSGAVEVTAVTLRRGSGWNEAALTFDKAAVVTEKSEWCGSVNWIRNNAHKDCEDNRKNTPKWKVWLNPNDKLLVAADILLRHLLYVIPDRKNVRLNVYRAPNTTAIEDILFSSLVRGRKTFPTKRFVNQGPASWFYLELQHNKQPLYEYAIAFEVQRDCRDAPKGQLLFLPKDEKTCRWLSEKSTSERMSICNSKTSNADLQCPQTCELCSDECMESPTATFYLQRRNCKFLRNKMSKLKANGKLDRYCNDSVAGSTCLETCGKCPPTT